MEDYQKLKIDLVDKLAAQQELVHETLKSQNEIHQNLSDLLDVFNDVETLIDGLKDSKYNQMSTVFKKNQMGDKASDLLKMNLEQIIKNKNTIMRKKTNLVINNALTQSTILTTPIELNEAAKKDLKSKDEQIKVDPFIVILDQIETLLVEQKIFEAVSQFKKLVENQKNEATMFTFLKKKKFENIIIEELKTHVAHLSTFESIDYQIIIPYIDTLIYFGKIEDALMITLNFTSKLFIQVFPKLSFSDRFTKMMETAVVTVSFLKEKFKPHFPQNEFFILFSNWLMSEFEIVLNEFVKNEKENEDLRENLEKLKIDIASFDLKGLGLDFLIEKRLLDIKNVEEEEKVD